MPPKKRTVNANSTPRSFSTTDDVTHRMPEMKAPGPPPTNARRLSCWASAMVRLSRSLSARQDANSVRLYSAQWFAFLGTSLYQLAVETWFARVSSFQCLRELREGTPGRSTLKYHFLGTPLRSSRKNPPLIPRNPKSNHRMAANQLQRT